MKLIPLYFLGLSSPESIPNTCWKEEKTQWAWVPSDGDNILNTGVKISHTLGNTLRDLAPRKKKKGSSQPAKFSASQAVGDLGRVFVFL